MLPIFLESTESAIEGYKILFFRGVSSRLDLTCIYGPLGLGGWGVCGVRGVGQVCIDGVDDVFVSFGDEILMRSLRGLGNGCRFRLDPVSGPDVRGDRLGGAIDEALGCLADLAHEFCEGFV